MISDIEEYQVNRIIFQSVVAAGDLCFVLDGIVDLLADFPDGLQKAWMDVTSGFLSCWSSIIYPYRYSFGARTASSEIMLNMDGEKLRQQMASDHDLGFVIMSHVASAIADRLRNT